MKIHFIGIGGIGVSALAQHYLSKGHQVSGSDLVDSEIIQVLKNKGAEISIGKNTIKKNADLTIYSPAVKTRHPMSGFLSYPQALGKLTKEYFTIAVSGTHGKSTTSAMISLILTKAGLDPTVIVGTKIKEFTPPVGGSNYRSGKSKYLVIEADEHFASFLNYWPKIIVLTNIEADHLDYYKNIKNVRRAFKEFISHLPRDGVLITAKQIEQGLISIIKIPGKHNLVNATLALKTARALKIPDKVSFKALSEYNGCWRRFDVRKIKQLTIVSDYGHHPTEVIATLKAVREKWPNKEIWCCFQPHQYQRTYYLFNDFVKVFSKAPVDKIIITDIYDVAGRESKKLKERVSAEKLVKAIKNPKVMYLPKGAIINYLRDNLCGKEVIVIMGAGDIYEIDRQLKGRNLFLKLT